GEKMRDSNISGGARELKVDYSRYIIDDYDVTAARALASLPRSSNLQSASNSSSSSRLQQSIQTAAAPNLSRAAAIDSSDSRQQGFCHSRGEGIHSLAPKILPPARPGHCRGKGAVRGS